jgi:imidazole glycerol-phosphate synthase subunit HisF
MVTKGIQFEGNKDIGKAEEFAVKYNASGADELVVYDITASIENRPPEAKTIQAIATKLSIPLTIGGGISTFAHASQCLQNGAEKISLNSIVPSKPELIHEISAQFGAQAVVLSLDILKNSEFPSGYQLVIHGGRTKTTWDVLNWLKYILPLGVGEICANSINEDGQKQGYDLKLLKLIIENATVPVIASGGAGNAFHIQQAFEIGAQGALLASVLHSGEMNISQLKTELSQSGIPMRLDF